MARELSKYHDVTVFTHNIGPFARAFPERVEYILDGHYDLALVNHNSCLGDAVAHADRVIFTSHGTVPPLEHPEPGADLYVAVSDEVRDYMGQLGFSATVILNGIDCDAFQPHNEPNRMARRVLSACHGPQAVELLAAVCGQLSLKFDYIHHDRLTMDVAEKMNWADIVVGLGRTAFEAMACGRAVLVMDMRGYMAPAMDGMVTRDNVDDLLRCNLSGRRLRIPPTPQSVAMALGGYKPSMGAFNRRFAEKHLNVTHAAERYLQLAATV
ncbi:MAG: glycosyltransferase [Actinobacteria bacterium]|nr:glycosyltransferase [Actinomycetota bacterium]MCG2808366.1 glycosyltransferase [Coriobacteriia bacterium]